MREGWKDARRRLLDRAHATRNPDTRQILSKAASLAKVNPNLSDAELVRLAYWGVSGDLW